MHQKLFSYGTLQLEAVQLENFGRRLIGHTDSLTQYEVRDCHITDSKVLSTSGEAVHPIACFTGSTSDEVVGMVFEVTAEEIAKTDCYEVDDYKKIKCQLKSGDQAWVYVQNV